MWMRLLLLQWLVYNIITLFHSLFIITFLCIIDTHLRTIFNKAHQDQDDEAEEEEVQAAYYAAKNSKKKESKKQDKEARRQVSLFL